MEKAYINFKVKTNLDHQRKSQLRNDFKNAQKIFDKNFRQTQRKFKKQSHLELERSAKENPTDMWAKLKKLNNPPSSRAALEIVRSDNTISHDIKEILERWLTDISKLFSGIRDNPEMVFDNDFYEDILDKKKAFENLSNEDQDKTCTFDSATINQEISFIEVSDAIDSLKSHKAYL